ncbi:MAG: A/G-specific adenine glycosylase, partial [Paludibacter sp.]|nr:A/G-specific adenine glycosylase [Paludibacter sp.]
MTDNNHPVSETLIRWYNENKRDLPWRNIHDPYKIWISEIILQQTRVQQGLDYYYRFVERFPDVQTLADASEDEVLKHWQGLGYYSRARNLHLAAHQIVQKHQGAFPTTYQEIIDLPGIGAYTAAAICSFAYHLPFAVVDGNVYRVLSRLFGIDTPIDSNSGKKIFQELAQEILDKSNPGLHNQAIMEFGALYCVPVSPNCEQCIFQDRCLSFANNNTSVLPVKTQKINVRKRYFNYLFIRHMDQTFLQKRTGNDVWKNLYEFPLIESDRLLDVNDIFHQENFQEITSGGVNNISIKFLSQPIKHILTHQQIYAQFFLVEIDELPAGMKDFEMIAIEEIE